VARIEKLVTSSPSDSRLLAEPRAEVGSLEGCARPQADDERVNLHGRAPGKAGS
jgi:hypothetical protein